MLMDSVSDPSFARMPRVDVRADAGFPSRRAAVGVLATSALGVLPLRAPAAPAGAAEAVAWPDVGLIDGRRWGRAQADGKTVVVVFWATTCPFCLRHNAHIEKLRRAAVGRPLEIVTVARDKAPAIVRAYLERHGYGFAVTLDHGPMAAATSSRRVIPLTVVVDATGRLRQTIPGEMFEDDVMELLPKA